MVNLDNIFASLLTASGVNDVLKPLVSATREKIINDAAAAFDVIVNNWGMKMRLM